MKLYLDFTENDNIILGIPLPNRTLRMLSLSKENFRLLKLNSEGKELDRLFSYPIGDFESVASNVSRGPGMIPTFEEESNLASTSCGLVWEIINHITGERARSRAIPWEFFETKTHEMEL